MTKTKTQVSRTINGTDGANHAHDAARRAVALDTLEERALALETEAAALHEQVAAARGTLTLSPEPAAAPARGTRDLERRPAGEYAQHATPASELYRQVRAALADKPYTFRDLCVAVGIAHEGENRVKSVIVRLQRDGHPVVNLGTSQRAIWWIDAHDRITAIMTTRAARK